MSSILTINGVTIAVPRDVVPGQLTAFTRDGYPRLELFVRGGALPALPDPYLAKEVTLTIGGTLVFKGDVVSLDPQWHDALGWVRAYSCHGLAARTERFPHIDANTGTTTSVYNTSEEDTLNYLPARAGRTVGQIIADVLSFKTNGDALTARGIGNLTYVPASGTYTLPAATAGDCAALALIPHGPVYFQGQQFWHALMGFVQEFTRNYLLHIEPGGNIRILDVRGFTPHTFTMGIDPIRPTELRRDWGGCFPRVLIQGAPIAVMALLKTSNGSLLENFAYGSFTNTTAKASWTPGQFHQASVQDQGACTCPDTLHVTVTSSNSSYTWSSNYWDFTAAGRHGVINLYSTVVTGVTQVYTARIVSNTALAAGGNSTLTLDIALPHTSFDRYTITGLAAQDGSIVWRKYQIANTSLWPKVTSQSTFAQPFFNSGGGVTLTSTPIGAVLWPISGTSPPYNQFPLPFTYDNNGNVYFAEPTYTVANSAAPADVWVLIPVYSDPNQAVAPADVGGVPQYSGTSYTVEGKTDTLVVPCPAWRDPANRANMQAYAAEILDAVKDTVVEGGIVYQGLYQPALTPGLKANVTGDGYTLMGWDTANLPIIETSLMWNLSGPTSWVTMMRCSSRRSYLGPEFYLAPDRTFASPLEADPFMGSQAAYGAAVGAQASGVLGGLIDATQFTGQIPDVGFVTPEAGRPASRTPEEQQESHHAAAEQRQQQLQQKRAAETARVAAARAAPAQELAQAQQERREQQQARTERANQLRAQRAERAQALREQVAARQATGGGTISRDPERGDELASNERTED